VWIDDEEAYPKNAKLGQLGTGSGSRDLLLNFGTPSMFKEWLKIQTSNLVCRLTTRGAIQKFEKLGQTGRRPGSRDLDDEEAYPKIAKLGQLGHVTYF